MNKRNYSKELDAFIEDFQKKGEYPKLLLHACCAPCSSYCMEFLRNFFDDLGNIIGELFPLITWFYCDKLKV